MSFFATIKMIVLGLLFGSTTFYYVPEDVSRVTSNALYAPPRVVYVDTGPVDAQIEPVLPSFSAQFEGLGGRWGGQCIGFIQRFFGPSVYYGGFQGDADQIFPNSRIPEIGAVVLTFEPSRSQGKIVAHAAIIIDIEGDELILADSNYGRDEIIQIGRRLKIHDWRIRGYYHFRGVEN